MQSRKAVQMLQKIVKQNIIEHFKCKQQKSFTSF